MNQCACALRLMRYKLYIISYNNKWNRRKCTWWTNFALIRFRFAFYKSRLYTVPVNAISEIYLFANVCIDDICLFSLQIIQVAHTYMCTLKISRGRERERERKNRQMTHYIYRHILFAKNHYISSIWWSPRASSKFIGDIYIYQTFYFCWQNLNISKWIQKKKENKQERHNAFSMFIRIVRCVYH